jgi:NADP-dependent 3-hydroxy acid dehydrogenase YdfG
MSQGSLMKKVIVISGVTSGVGEELSRTFIDLDWLVVGLARNKEKLKKLTHEFGKNFTAIETDITDENSVAASFKFINNQFKKITLLVNNAAVFKMEKFSQCSFNDINSMIDTNLKGAMYCTLEAVQIMKASSHSARIINVASVAAIHGIKGQAIYCASKFGLNGFAEALNQELIQEGISITTLYPGGINTPLWNETNPYPGENKEEILQPKDVVSVIKYVSELESRIILKNLTIFPSNEWH